MFGSENENWKADALRLAEKESPIKMGSFQKIHTEIKRLYPNLSISYDMVRLFLVRNGYSTGIHKRSGWRKKATPTIKNFEVITEGKYALVKMDRNGNILGKPLPIDRDEALKIIERKVF